MFGRMTKKQYDSKLAKIREQNKTAKRKERLRNAKYKSPSSGIETSKIIAIYLFGLLNAIVVYAMVSMWHFSDLSYLGVLITDIAAQILIYAIYCLKAYHGKKQEEEMSFRRDKYSGSLNDLLKAKE